MSTHKAAGAAAKQPSQIDKLTVSLGERSYDILIGPGLIDRAGAEIKGLLRRPRTFVVTDQNVAALYLERLMASLEKEGIRAESIILPAGEATKSFTVLEQLIDRLLEARLERSDMIIALGGGVIGDLTGFAAAILRRGIDFIQIPTTLLAQVDSSVGGKTGINTRLGKNLAGIFHQPRLVLADVSALATLPRRQLLAGYAEVVKYGLIDDAEFFEWLETKGPDLLSGDLAALQQAIRRSCAAKARIVAEDERESGKRALLNLGHTFGHALEAETGYGDDLYHGEAVAMGINLAFDLSVRLNLCPAAEAERVHRHFGAAGLPGLTPQIGNKALRAENLLAHMAQDKKVKEGKITFVLAYGIGKSFLKNDVAESAVLEALQDALAASEKSAST
jgi:3-dehydroquinate synthase